VLAFLLRKEEELKMNEEMADEKLRVQEQDSKETISFGQLIFGKRKQWRIRQDELSKRVDINRSTLVDIERLKIGIDEPTFRKLMNALDESIEEKRQTALASRQKEAKG
jgi:DNA-binding XRE family transcriptional regulator